MGNSPLHTAGMSWGFDIMEHDHSQMYLPVAHGISIVTILLYFCYFFFRMKTHRYLYDDELRDEEATEVQSNIQLLGPVTAGLIFLLSITLIQICCRHIIRSLGKFSDAARIPESLTVLVLLPVLDHPSDIFLGAKLAWGGRTDLSINLTLETSVVILSFLNPFFVLLGWAFDQPYAVQYTLVQLFYMVLASVTVCTHGLANGKTNWLSGVICLAL